MPNPLRAGPRGRRPSSSGPTAVPRAWSQARAQEGRPAADPARCSRLPGSVLAAIRAPRRCACTQAYRGALVVHRRSEGSRRKRAPLDRYLAASFPGRCPTTGPRGVARAGGGRALVRARHAQPGTLLTSTPTREPGLRWDRGRGGHDEPRDRSTAGRIVSWQGRVATTCYHSTSGGRTRRTRRPGRARRSCPISFPSATRSTAPRSTISGARPSSPRPRRVRGSAPASSAISSSPRGLGLCDRGGIEGERQPTGRSVDFRRALEMRSAWFTIRVLHLEETTAGRALAAAGHQVVLAAPRGLRKVRLEQQVNGGTWTAVRPSGRAPTAGSRSPSRRSGRQATGSRTAPPRAPITVKALGRVLTRASSRPLYRGPMRYALTLAVAVAALLASAAPADASRFVRYGLQDDAWLAYGPGTLDERLDTLDRMGVGLVRYTLDWSRIEGTEGGPDWDQSDAILRGLNRRGIVPVVTLWGTPRWANGGRSPNWAPRSKWTFPRLRAARGGSLSVRPQLADLERAEPAALAPPDLGARLHADPAQSRLRRHPPRDPGARWPAASPPRAGPTAASRRSTSFAAWTAPAPSSTHYTHNPYPLRRFETPSSGGCAPCETICSRRSTASSGTCTTRSEEADLADRVRLPDEPARPAPRRLALAAGAYLAEAAQRRTRRPMSTC